MRALALHLMLGDPGIYLFFCLRDDAKCWPESDAKEFERGREEDACAYVQRSGSMMVVVIVKENELSALCSLG